MLNIRKRFFLLLTVIGVLICFVACTKTDTLRVSFDQTVYEIKVGQTLDITPIIDNESSVDDLKTEYSTNDSSVATFVDGKLTGVQQGETMIKIVCTGNQKKDGTSVTSYDIAKVKVVGNTLPDVSFVEPQKSMVKGTTQKLEYSFVPEYATANMTFLSANQDVATVDENGVITAVGTGTAVIIARAIDIEDNTKYQDYAFTIEVIEADFTISYELNGGVNNPNNPAGYNVLSLPVTLNAPTKDAYRFLGWYDNAEFTGEAITEIAAGTRGNITLYANWELVEFTINYNLDGGENSSKNPSVYNVEELPLTLSEPNKNGYNFVGWFDGETQITEIAAGTTGEVNLTAKYELATYTISFDLNGGAWQDLEGKVYPYEMNRDAMVREFVVDFNKHAKKSVAADGSDFFARSYMNDSSSAGYKFLTSKEYGEKWKWMLNYLNDMRVKNGKSELKDTDNQAEARGEIHNFLNACAPGEKGGNSAYGCDYSTADAANGFWIYTLYLPKVEVVNEYTMLSEDIVLPVAYRTGYKFVGWQNGDDVIDKIVKGTYGDLNLVAKWETVEYTLDLKLNGGAWASKADLSNAEVLKQFTLSYYLSFNSSGYDACLHNSVSWGRWWYYISLKETTVKGMYEIVQVVAGSTKLTEPYDLVIGWHDDIKVEDRKTALFSIYNNSSAFIGKYVVLDNVPAEKSSDCNIDVTIYEPKNVVITGEPNTKYNIEQEFVIPTPTREGYEFLGWYDGKNKVEKLPVGSIGNRTLVAEWYNADEKLPINYNLNGGSLSETDPKEFIAKDGLAELPTPVYPGCKFLGWFTDEACTEAITSIESGRNKGVTVYASWEVLTFKIEYETNGGVFLSDAEAPLYDSFELLVEEFLADYGKLYDITGLTASTFYGKSSKYGVYSFFKNAEMATKWGWLLDHMVSLAKENNYAGKPSMELTATAANFNKYMRVNLAALFQETRLTTVSPASMDFTNVDGEALWSACPTKIIQVGIEAKYEYTVNDLPLVIATPNKEGATFVAWYTNANLKVGETSEITVENIGNIKLYARWSDSVIPQEEYTIEYELNGGTLPENAPIKKLEGVAVNLLPATKAEFKFVGWYNNPECTGDAITEIPADMNENIKLYAKWEALVYKTVSYELDGGTLSENAPTKYVVTEGLSLEGIVPTKDGYKFLGWYDNAECVGKPLTEISKDSTEDVTLYALWTDDTARFNVTYNLNGGNTMYSNREELVADFLSDFSKVTEKNITVDNFTTIARITQFDQFIKDDNMWAKWKWLFEFIASTDKHESAADFYNKVINNRDNNDANFHWFLTRDFGGFVAKTLANFWFSVSPVDYTTFANGDGFWDLLQEKYTENNVNTLITPYRPFYVFEGWYDNAELTGTPVTVPSSDCELYAKWRKDTVKLTYVINNEDATLEQTEVDVHASDSFALANPTYNTEYYKFNGWYLEPECVTIIRDIKEYTNTPVTVYGSWTELDGYTINYVLNGGSLIYPDRDAVVSDFLKDYSAATGKNYVVPGDIATGNFADIDYHTLFDKVLPDGTNMREKWQWLAEYLLEVSTRDLAANNCNVLGLKAIVNNTAYTGDAKYGVSYAFRAFLIGTTLRPNSSYTTVDFSIYENAHGFWNKLSAAENTEYLNNKGEVELPIAYLENYKFAGWYTNAECTGDPVTKATSECTLYAKYVEATPVDSVSIDNKVSEIKRFEEYQLTWTINPSNANIQTVKFTSSDPSVATIDKDGKIVAVANGTTVIRMTSTSPTGKYDEFSLTVYSPDHFDISYETESYTTVGKTIKLLAEYIKRDTTAVELVWSSLNENIATVDALGVVTGVSVGQATIRVAVKGEETAYQDFVVMVLDNNLSNELQYLLGAHNSNIFVKYELGIGAGKPAYYKDIIGSVSNILFNDPLTINDKYLAQGNAQGNNSGKRPSTEFITVHYTGNMGNGANAAANASYFVGTQSSSIHFTTGNDGIFQCMDTDLIAWHAGDGASSKFEWTATGVMYNENDPKYPTFGVSKNAKFEINGKETSIAIPKGETPATLPDKVAGTGDRWINDMGLAWKVENGQYYMGTTWWCYSQVAEGRICSRGGNRHSIGIESCVDKGSDLWFTWQRTAKLVAKLMLDWDLDITRVKGHHFYSAKDCPQPLLENDLEIWWVFIDMVEHEYELLTTYKDATVTFTSNSDIVDNHGRITQQPLFSQIVTYTVTLNGQSITLATAVEGMYNKDCGC